MRIDKPGIYDISAEEYHNDPCPTPSLSASIVKVVADETPLHAWTLHPKLNPNFERKEEDKFVIGTVAHSLMLRDPKNFAILDFDTYQSKAAKEARDAARELAHRFHLLRLAQLFFQAKALADVAGRHGQPPPPALGGNGRGGGFDGRAVLGGAAL